MHYIYVYVCVCILRQRCLTGLHHWRLHREWPDRWCVQSLPPAGAGPVWLAGLLSKGLSDRWYVMFFLQLFYIQNVWYIHFLQEWKPGVFKDWQVYSQCAVLHPLGVKCWLISQYQQTLIIFSEERIFFFYFQISGLVIGRFYSDTGQPTEALLQVQASLAEGQQIKAKSEAEMIRFPACNSEWSAARGGRVWCSKKRFGIVLV